ncbi:type II secretion system protein [Hazenella sp. IB182357]|uniref:Type II secretion system protein n=1 Tax=Polycladospora coralii TaxID=2771432 RepID=A0A926RT40_9BACL|nr:type II secretion system protein [Polycladospora coralii]MBD1371218.1 type II secretion system protein [Polycladospora coralii]
MSDEKGFTLMETLVALMILGLFVSFALPIHDEIKAQQQALLIESEALQLLKMRAEQWVSNTDRQQTSVETIKSQHDVNTIYQVTHAVEQIKPHLMRYTVEIEWKNNQQSKRKQLTVEKFSP